MRERPRNKTGGAAPGRDSWSEINGAREALVAHGTYRETLPVAGMTVSAVRDRYGDRFDLDPAAEAIVQGRRAGEDHVIRGGETLVFAHRVGEKG